MRGFVVLVFGIAFLLAICGLALIPGEAWEYMSWSNKALLAFYVLVGLCGVLLAYFVYEDGETIRQLRKHTGLTDERLEELRKREIEELRKSRKKSS